MFNNVEVSSVRDNVIGTVYLSDEIMDFIITHDSKDKAVVLNNIYNSIFKFINSDHYKVIYSMSELDEMLLNIFSKEYIITSDRINSITGVLLMESKKILSFIGIELEDLSELSIGIVSNIMEIINMFPGLSLGLEDEVLRVCDSLSRDRVLDLSRLIKSYGYYDLMDYYNSIKSVDDVFFNKLRTYLDNSTLDLRDDDSIDFLNFINKINYRYDLFKPYKKTSTKSWLEVYKHAIGGYIDTIVNEDLTFRPITELINKLGMYLDNKKEDVTDKFYTIVAGLIFTIIVSEEGQRVFREDDVIDIINKFELMDNFIISELISLDNNDTPDKSSYQQHLKAVELSSKYKIEIVESVMEIRRK